MAFIELLRVFHSFKHFVCPSFTNTEQTKIRTEVARVAETF